MNVPLLAAQPLNIPADLNFLQIQFGRQLGQNSLPLPPPPSLISGYDPYIALLSATFVKESEWLMLY